ncbi:MAG: protein-export chaperone SecB [Hyphomonadaceae bacterium]|nr:protein-export chaperone SecB [Hyphomonadaceae bacterium]
MTDTPDMATPPQGNAQQPGPAIRVLSQYIKDLSFENPGATVQDQPNIELGIDVGATPKQGDEGVFEVTLKLKARAGTPDTALFLLEMDYAGQFQLQGFSAADMEPILLIECPRILFPFARRIIADVSSEGGFPPLRIDPVDFGQLYATQKQRAAAAAQEQAAASTPAEPQA